MILIIFTLSEIMYDDRDYDLKESKYERVKFSDGLVEEKRIS